MVNTFYYNQHYIHQKSICKQNFKVIKWSVILGGYPVFMKLYILYIAYNKAFLKAGFPQ